MSALLPLTILLAILIPLTTLALALTLLALHRLWQHTLNLQYLITQLTHLAREQTTANKSTLTWDAADPQQTPPSMIAPRPIPKPILSWPLETMERRTPMMGATKPPLGRQPGSGENHSDVRANSVLSTRESSPRSFI